jgi:hypothetical protein
MYVRDDPLTALKKLYRKNLLADIGASLSAVVLMILLFVADPDSFTPEGLAITLALSLALAITEYILERLLRKRGLSSAVVSSVCLIIILILGALLLGASLAGLLGFFFFRPLLPLVALLRDRARLADGALCESIGQAKKGSRQVVPYGLENLDTVVLFEDELTHQKHLIRAVGISSLHRCRVYFLPHSGLAVGEIIPDGMQFDPFGNPVDPVESPADGQTSDVAFDAPPSGASRSVDPNSPERQKAARYAACKKICIC